MKKWVVVMVVIMVIVREGNMKRVEGEGEEGFIRRKGVKLELNGSPFYGNGFNAYWLMYFAAEPSQRDKVTSTFQQAKQHGLSFARTWAFNDAQDRALQSSPGSYVEQTFQGLDFVISEAKKYGMKLVLSLVNNYEDFGGKKQYVNWARNEGHSLSSEDDFFTNSLVKQYYKNHIKVLSLTLTLFLLGKFYYNFCGNFNVLVVDEVSILYLTVLTRRNSITGIAYKDEPTIMAWELMNEPRCPSDRSGNTIQAWITEMASYLKSIDAKHLLEAGLEGFYGQSSSSQKHQFNNPNFQIGTDFIANNQIPDIDFATVHSYPDQWLTNSSEETQQSFLINWLNTHIQDAEEILQKPLLFAEFGRSSRTSNYSQRDELFNTVYAAIYSSAQHGGAAVGGMFWQLLTEGMDSFRDGYEVVFSENPSTASIIADASQKLNRIRKMYARLRNIEKWKQARDMRRAQRLNSSGAEDAKN